MRITLLLLLVLAAEALAGPPQPIAWADVKASNVAVAEAGGEVVATVVAGEVGAVPLLTLRTPELSETSFGLRGQVRLEGAARGYLELWVSFEGGGRYFSRTQAETGPMAWLAGSGEWRPFLVPFQAAQSTTPVSALELNLVLDGAGTAQFADLALVEAATPRELLEQAQGLEGAWWSDRVGGLAGGGMGLLLGLFGALAGTLASRGKARGFVMTALAVIFAVGAGLSALAVAALATQQPYGVWFPLLLVGGLTLALGAFGRRGLARAYTAYELRRMRAADAA